MTVRVCVGRLSVYVCVKQVLSEMVGTLSTVSGISRVLYDLTSKPPGTTEWE